MLVLHHHQRAGTQEPISIARRSRAHHSRQSARKGVKRFFITDDNFARNRDWEVLLDRIILLRETDGIVVN